MTSYRSTSGDKPLMYYEVRLSDGRRLLVAPADIHVVEREFRAWLDGDHHPIDSPIDSQFAVRVVLAQSSLYERHYRSAEGAAVFDD